MTQTSTPVRDLTHDQYLLADRIIEVVEVANSDGYTPSVIARKAKAEYRQVREVLDWLVEYRYVHTSGNGAWTHYHAGR
jgi:hypothetical protein